MPIRFSMVINDDIDEVSRMDMGIFPETVPYFLLDGKRSAV